MQPIWKGIYNNGEIVSDSNGDTFNDIQRDRLVRFSITYSSFCLSLDCKTGVLSVNNDNVNNNTLNKVCNKGLHYNKGIIQYKGASVFITGNNISDEYLQSINLGYKVSLNNIMYKFILSHDVNSKETYLQIKITNLITKQTLEEAQYRIE